MARENREDVQALLQKIDVLLVPSRQDPLPTVVIEAGLSGVPVLGSRVGGMKEMLEEGKNGYFAESGLEYGEKVAALLAPGAWERASRNARDSALALYDIRVLADQLVAHYEAVKNA